ncbi:hypothetical protein CEXT_468301 [Caerostris extrusa]|uniref:Pre-C2HC domain-containing protein n=1 Tax=Caerostris extrusa TaxID=172846 RepID=A0AAV4P621_CAEEX|nr:hypothetical protein CEXT_468301 [Caerostris extrusa]
MADDANPPEQPPRRQRIHPPPFFFVKGTKDWGSILPQLKTISPTLNSVLSRENFLKITVATEVEHVRMKNKLVQFGLEFKCFNLKQDRPVKVMIRGLPACTFKEDINFALTHLGFKVLAVNQLLKGLSHFHAEFLIIQPTHHKPTSSAHRRKEKCTTQRICARVIQNASRFHKRFHHRFRPIARRLQLRTHFPHSRRRMTTT